MLRLSSRNGDLIDCLNVQPLRIGLEAVGRDEALRAWRWLAASRSFTCTVIEADPPIQGHRIVGFGASVFVSPKFAIDELANPRPGLNSRIIASIVEGHPVVLSETELRSANTFGDLDLVILYGSFRTGILSSNELLDGYTLMGSIFMGLHTGYRIRQLINETVDEIEKHHNDRTHAWRVLSNYEEFWAMHPDAPWDRIRALGVIQKDMLALSGSMINILFRYQRPVLQLRDEDQQLLIAALTGLTDEALAQRMAERLPTIKRRWLSLYARTLELLPDLFPDWAAENNDAQRGKQKRHHLLAYVREHPEELRPIETAALVVRK